jgi:hypothetical protein
VSCVYLVVAGEVCEPQTLTPLGAFNNESLAQAFIDLTPLPQRRCLGIQRWEINQPTRDPFWREAETGPCHDGSASDVDESKTRRAFTPDRAFLRFRKRLLLWANDGHGNASI